MKSIGEIIRELRIKEDYPLRKVAAFLDIDQAVLSKIERGQRRISKEQVMKLADFFNYSEKELMLAYFSDRIVYELADEEYAKEALRLAESKIDYKRFISIGRDDVLKKIVKVLEQFSKLKSAWVYGSFSRADDTAQSDIDIAIKADDDFSYFDLAEIKQKLQKEIDRKVDIGFISSFKPHIFKNIQNDLKIIYER